MITNVADIYPTMRSLVSLVTQVAESQVILADQGAPTPSGLYVTYNPIPVRAWGHPRTERELVAATEDFNQSLLGADWKDYEATTVTTMEFLLSINALNAGARDALTKTHNANFRWPVQEFLWANGVAYRNASEVRNLTGLDRAAYQERFQVDVSFWLETAVTDDVLRANDFEFTIEDEGGNVLYQEA